MRCAHCDRDNPAGSRFCLGCGRPLEVACAGCGSALPPDAAFCNNCGAALAAPADQPGNPSIAADTQAPAPAPGERRQATVLFSDLVGFTALSEKLDPEEVEGLMRRLKQRAVEIVEAHGGIVSQFVGDEVLALFGIPAAHEDDPVRAVRAGLALHGLAHELSGDVADRIGQPLRMHTGVDSGLVVTSAADARDGVVGVTGDTVNTAARLKGAAEADAVLVSPETQRRVAAFFETEALAPVELKGKAAPLVPHRVASEKGVATRFEAATVRGLTSFAGREGELSTLTACLEQAMTGQGQIVTVMGEAGVGKSRLIYEFRQSLDRSKITVIEGRCQSYGAETPYLPLLDALRRGIRIHELTDPVALHDTAVANIRGISPELEPYLPHLLHLLSIPSETHRLPESLQGDALRRDLEAALAGTITLNTGHGPMVAIYEDWHWADEASDAVLNLLVGLVGHYPLLLVVLYRPEYPRKWADLAHYTPIVLHSLEVAQTEQMLRSVWDVRALPEGLAAAVHARSGGNALFNEELAHALRESGGVAVESGEARLTRPLEALTLPDTVHAVIRSRVDCLEPADREVLRLASVIGREFDRAVLEKIAGSREQVARALERLARQDLVHQVRVVPQAEYIFKHVLTQEVVYETLLLAQRKELHAAVGAALEQLHAGRLEPYFELLAEQYSASGMTEKAIEYLEKAADKAVAIYLIAEATGMYHAAIRLLDEQGSAESYIRQRIAVTCKWARVGSYVPVKADVTLMRQSVEHARRLQDHAALAEANFWLGNVHYYLGDPIQAQHAFNQSIELASVIEDPALLADIRLSHARTYIFQNKFRETIERLEAALPAVEGAGIWFQVAAGRFYVAVCHGWMGDFEKSLEYVDRAIEVSKEHDVLFTLAWAEFIGGYMLALKSDWVPAQVHLTEGHAIANRMGIESPAAQADVIGGYVRVMTDQADSGWTQVVNGIEILEATDYQFIFGMVLGRAAEAALVLGRLMDASRYCKTASVYFREGNKYGELLVRGVEACLSLVSDTEDPARAHSRMRHAFDLAKASESKVCTASNHFRYAECLHKKGDLDAAREQLDQAEALFREMGMDWWTEQAEGLRGRLDRGEPFVWFAPYVNGPPAIE